MPNITLLDGKQLSFSHPVSGIEIAEKISKSLSKIAIAMRVNDKLCDLALIVTDDAQIEIITPESTDGLEIIRHDAAHVLAEAVKELYPNVQITIGPVIEDGFYYDIANDESFSENDLALIEERMHEIVERNEKITREVWQREQAIKFFQEKGEKYKAEIIQGLPAEEEVSLYRQGNFIDLCRGPHLPSTGKLGHAFKLTKISGAYWRGDSRNQMLQRIYGTAWPSKQELDNYLYRIEEAKKRDHRLLGKAMDLFHLQDDARGSVFWHAEGWALYRNLENYIRKKLKENRYIEVRTPMLMDSSFWKKSGHWDYFRKNMFVAEMEEQDLALKPMNCPGHVQIYNQGIKSYRDLPLRMAEFGSCHRCEPSGALQGLLRLRGFVQDDAHIFCTPEQISSETTNFCKLLKQVYSDLGFEDISIKFSDRPKERAGDDAVWDQAEAALREAAESSGLKYQLNPGEGAFYGPKLEFVLRDALQRSWQCGTLQVDFILPQRLDAYYVAEDGSKRHPVMLHRAILGSLERFIGILLEHKSLPLWLAPTQIVIATLTNDSDHYAIDLEARFNEHGFRAKADLRNEKINLKVREWSLKKVPIIAAIGKREIENNELSLRFLGESQPRVMKTQEFFTWLQHHGC